MPSPSPTALDDAELARRKPVWSELSRLWLDTELDDGDLRLIADSLRHSGYDLAALERIYRREVAPVVYGNTQIVAGVWDGFDPEWLHAAARRNAEGLGLGKRLMLAFPPTRRLMFYAAEPEWQRVVAMLRTAAAP
jgi:hypothetical protein